MKLTLAISLIYKQLISAFASLDEWLDRVLDEGEEEDTVLEVGMHILRSNHHLLQEAFIEKDAVPHDIHSTSPAELEALRRALREQLLECLFILETLEELNSDFTSFERQEILERLYTLRYHVQFHLEEFEQVQ